MRRVVVLMVLTTFVLGMSEFMVMGVLPDIADGLGTGHSEIGLMVSVFALSYAAFTPIISGRVERISPYRAMVALYAVFIVANLWTADCSGYWSMMFSRVVTAAVSGALFSVGMVIVSRVVTPGERAGSVAWMYAGFNISSILGVPLGVVFTEYLGWRYAFLMIAVAGTIALSLCMVNVPRDIPPSPASEKGGLDLLGDRRIIMGFMITMFTFAGTFLMYTYINPLLMTMGFEDSGIGLGIMVFGVMCMVSNLYAARLSSRGGLRIGRFTFMLQTVMYVILPTAMLLPVLGYPVFLVTGLLMYIMNSSVQMLLMNVASSDYPGSMTLATSLNPTAFNIGIAMGSLTGGFVYDAAGVFSLGYAAAVFILMAGVVCLILCWDSWVGGNVSG